MNVRYSFFLLLLAFASGAVVAEPDYLNVGPYQCGYIQDEVPDTAKKNVLIIGDSISIGYIPVVRENLTDFDVYHSPCNASWSGYIKLHIDSWLSKRKYDVVIFNNGVRDLNTESISLKSYDKNMTDIADRVLQETDDVYFVQTSKHPRPYFDLGNEVPRQNLMRQLNEFVIGSRGIDIIRLGKAGDALEGFKINDQVHYSSEGYQVIGKANAGKVKTNSK